MRRTPDAQHRCTAARALFAGAAILAGVAAPAFSPATAQEAHEDTAMAIPRLVPPRGSAVPLPRPLPASVARLIAQAFRDPAAPLIELADSPLLGHIQADRLLAPAARPPAEDLRHWLARYADLPDAPLVYAALAARLPRGGIRPEPPTAPTLTPAFTPTFTPAFKPAPAGDDVEVDDRILPRNPALDRTVRDAARAGQFDRALRIVARTPGLSPAYGAMLRAEIARAMFSQGNDLQALATAEAAHHQAHGAVGLAPWVGGLAAWRLGRYELAHTWFEAAWRASLITPGQRAGAAYWAARATLVTRGDHGPWMRRAAQDPRTFYGLLARRALGEPLRPTPAFDRNTLAEADIDAVAATARGWRAFALLQVGQPHRAAAELRMLFTETRDQPGFARSILLVARAAPLSDLAGQLDALLQPFAARLPAATLRPTGGFRLDPALVHALARLESNFDAEAISPSGARGLLQLMPVTAKFVMGAAPELHDPATNLDVGQRYLLHLTTLEAVGSDLIRLLASYNAGPGNFARWLDLMHPENDPLLFIEALPGDQARAYVPRALAYTWLYAAQLGLPSPSLDDLASGLWPRVQIRPTRRDSTPRLH